MNQKVTHTLNKNNFINNRLSVYSTCVVYAVIVFMTYMQRIIDLWTLKMEEGHLSRPFRYRTNVLKSRQCNFVYIGIIIFLRIA